MFPRRELGNPINKARERVWFFLLAGERQSARLCPSVSLLNGCRGKPRHAKRGHTVYSATAGSLGKGQNVEPRNYVPPPQKVPQQWTGNTRQLLGDPVPLCAWWKLSQETFPAAEREERLESR